MSKIESAKVIVCSSGRNFVTLKVFTDYCVYGLGVDMNEEETKKHPNDRAYLPLNRKEDHTMFN